MRRQRLVEAQQHTLGMQLSSNSELHTVLAIASWRIIIYYCHYRVLYIYVADACGEPLFNNVLMHYIALVS